MRFLLMSMVATGLFAAGKPVDFLREIRPILSDACFQCHGPDESTRMANLRLDQKESALAKITQIAARVGETKPGRKMPPAHAKVRLNAAQVGLIQKWASEGGAWQEHWSFVAPKRAEPPAVRLKAWPKGNLDRFVLVRLEQENLKPSPEADKPTLLRRLSLDLTGLPPTPQEIDAFLNDKTAGAYEKQVDRLLASPRFGEKMALHWLDLARYADTHGYHIDSHRDMWPWRDWLIGAFNRNMPYDQFTIWQLAGDMLPNATREQIAASGFNRNHVINYEGGAIPEEYQAEYVIDRVEATGTTWLGLTVGCARCHDHKYDPIAQKDFYRLFAFFNNIEEKGLDGQKGNAAPFLKLPTDTQATLEKEMTQAIAAREKRIEDAKIADRMAEWEKTKLSKMSAPARNGLAAHYELEGNFNEATGTYLHGRYLGLPPTASDGPVGQSALLDTGARIEIPEPNGFNEDAAFSLAFWFRGGNKLEPLTILTKKNGAGIEIGNDEVFSIGDLRRGAHLVITLTDAAGGKRVYQSKRPFPYNEFTHFTLNHQGAGAIELRMNGEAEELAVSGETKPMGIRNGAPIVFAQMIGSLDDLRIYNRELSAAEARQLAIEEPVRYLLFHTGIKRSKAQAAMLRDYYLKHDSGDELKSLYARLNQLKAEKKQLDEQIPSTMVMKELEKPRESNILKRGQYDQKGERVEVATPSFLPPMPSSLPRNRLGLAQWLVSKEHPLTARVAVNRFWAMYFGNGFVKTVEDFGSQGEAPSHPELLDALAMDFIESGWDLKKLQKQIVMSATYRQSARVTPELKERDPENRLLARMSRFRIQAELVRDNALAVSGLLNGEIGGRSVSPYQPPGLWEEVAYGAQFSAQRYEQSHGKDLYRRGMYSFWKRTLPPASLAIFDAPDREKCVARRATTNTPLQALALWNDTTYLEAARKLAERSIREAGADPAKRLKHMFRLATARYPSATEMKLLQASLDGQMAEYKASPEAARKLTTTGESKIEASDTVELAAWMSVASAILNLDEVLTKE
ncbi:MAG: DUF1553 domain-containing protein [Acidobacteria bacterium]|nr:DUF1553 domain-containing protein [Acidobacteriota bacterium]